MRVPAAALFPLPVHAKVLQLLSELRKIAIKAIRTKKKLEDEDDNPT